MPSWNVHLEAGERIADKLKFTEKERREFLFGCLLPDINNGYVNHPHVVKTHEDTHYKFDDQSSHNFYNENQARVDDKDPMYLGYLFHLYTDGFFNYDFEKRIKGTAIAKKSPIEQENLKHNDFWLYGTTFRHFLDIAPDEIDEFAKKANEINPIEIDADDIIELAGIIRVDEINDEIRDNKYILYTKKDFDDLLENLIKEFTKKYLERT